MVDTTSRPDTVQFSNALADLIAATPFGTAGHHERLYLEALRLQARYDSASLRAVIGFSLAAAAYLDQCGRHLDAREIDRANGTLVHEQGDADRGDLAVLETVRTPIGDVEIVGESDDDVTITVGPPIAAAADNPHAVTVSVSEPIPAVAYNPHAPVPDDGLHRVVATRGIAIPDVTAAMERTGIDVVIFDVLSTQLAYHCETCSMSYVGPLRVKYTRRDGSIFSEIM